jgi:hypothetical protein
MLRRRCAMLRHSNQADGSLGTQRAINSSLSRPKPFPRSALSRGLRQTRQSPEGFGMSLFLSLVERLGRKVGITEL